MAAAGTAYSWTGKRIRSSGDWVGARPKKEWRPFPVSSTAGRAETAAGAAGRRAEQAAPGSGEAIGVGSEDRLESQGNARCILMASLSVRGQQIQRKEFSISHWRMKP